MAVVRGRSMEPTLLDGERLLVRHGRRPAVGQLGLVYLPDGTLAVKRLELEDDGWWFSRDNPRIGTDSWSWGRPAQEDDIVGTVVMRLWPRPRKL